MEGVKETLYSQREEFFIFSRNDDQAVA